MKIYEQVKSSSGLPCLTVTDDLTRATHIGVNLPPDKSHRLLHFYEDAIVVDSEILLPIYERVYVSSFQRFRSFIDHFYPKYGLPKIGIVLENDNQCYYMGLTNSISRLIRNGAHVIGIAQVMDPAATPCAYMYAPVRSDVWMSDAEKCVAYEMVMTSKDVYDPKIPYAHVEIFVDPYINHFIEEAICL